jgi:hypothetical protein
LHCLAYLETHASDWSEAPDPVLQNIERLPILAARWSVNPASLDERHFTTGRGIVGEIT